jgi:hypothetical protein
VTRILQRQERDDRPVFLRTVVRPAMNLVTILAEGEVQGLTMMDDVGQDDLMTRVPKDYHLRASLFYFPALISKRSGL